MELYFQRIQIFSLLTSASIIQNLVTQSRCKIPLDHRSRGFRSLRTLLTRATWLSVQQLRFTPFQSASSNLQPQLRIFFFFGPIPTCTPKPRLNLFVLKPPRAPLLSNFRSVQTCLRALRVKHCFFSYVF